MQYFNPDRTTIADQGIICVYPSVLFANRY